MRPTLTIGDVGTQVSDLQRLLKVTPDGWFGETTRAAVIAFQRKHGLLPDGVVGARTWSHLDGRPDSRRLTARDLDAAARLLDVPLAVIQTVADVESAGSGFLTNGKPKILFERHIFYRRLKEAGVDVDALVRRYPNLVYPKRGGYAGGTAEWSRLRGASQIDPDMAIEAASWGRFQIMGFHWQALGYDSVQSFYRAMEESEGRHLEAFCRFIALDPALHKALKGRRWPEFARRYNGPAYKDNHYDVKLARAYDRYAPDRDAA